MTLSSKNKQKSLIGEISSSGLIMKRPALLLAHVGRVRGGGAESRVTVPGMRKAALAPPLHNSPHLTGE